MPRLGDDKQVLHPVFVVDAIFSWPQEAQEELYELLAVLLSKHIIKGWTCHACGVFNGEEKERRAACRCCGLGRT